MIELKKISPLDVLHRLVVLSGGPGNLALMLGVERVSVYKWMRGKGISLLGYTLAKSSDLIPERLKKGLYEGDDNYPWTDSYKTKFDKQKKFEKNYLNNKTNIIIPFLIEEKGNK